MRRRDEALWFNLPGVVAAWQPVGAPGPLLARYNQAHGGSNTYQAVEGVAPTWHGATGWTFDGSTQYLGTNIFPEINTWSVLVRFSNAPTDENFQRAPFGRIETGDKRWTISYIGQFSIRYYQNGSYLQIVAAALSAGVMGFAGSQGYADGVAVGGAIGAGTPGALTLDVEIGRRQEAGYDTAWWMGDIQALAIWKRTLSPAEVWNASRQMAYCHVNPDWSAWGRRRRYYYAPAAAGGAAKMNTYYRRMRS